MRNHTKNPHLVFLYHCLVNLSMFLLEDYPFAVLYDRCISEFCAYRSNDSNDAEITNLLLNINLIVNLILFHIPYDKRKFNY